VSLLVLGALALILSVTLDLQTSIAGILAVAIDCAIYRAGRGVDDAAEAMGTGEVSLQDVAVIRCQPS